MMQLSRRVAVLLCGFVFLPPLAKAQTTVTIGTYDGEGFQTNTYTGSGAFVNTGSGSVNYWVSGSSSTSGVTGNAIIVTPISDPVIFFNNASLINGTGSPLLSLTLRLPQFPLGDPRRTHLGFLDTASLIDNNSVPFSVSFLDPIGLYDGDYLPFHGKPLFSTLHFYRGSGSAQIDSFASGTLSYYAAYPQEPLLAFLMDTAPASTNNNTPNPTIFNTPSNPGGGIRAVTPEAPGLVQLLPGLVPVALVLKRRRAKRG